MYGASQEVIEAYKADGVHKEFRVVIGNTSYGNEYIVDSSFNLKQSILDQENFEAIGCIASSLTVELRAQFSTKVRDKKITVYVQAGNTTELQIFTGYISKCTKTANGWNRSIEAYDYFYMMSGQGGMADENEKKQYDVTDWYNEHDEVRIGTLLNQVCSKFGLSVREGNKPLVNGTTLTKCGKEKKASSLSALDLIKYIMQVNGCFGYITGDGYFSWKYLLMPSYDETGWLYPSAYLYPSPDLYPGQDSSHAQSIENAKNFIGEYDTLQYQDFKMLPINMVKVRDYEGDEKEGYYRKPGAGVSSADNIYIIQGNPLIQGEEKSKKEDIAKNVFDVLNSTWYVPFEATLPGLPYLECGDEVNFYDFVGDQGTASLQRFYILTRTISGGQHLTDSWSANGNEYQHEFVTGTASDPGLKDELEQEIDEKIAEATGLFNIVSVPSYADIPDPPNTGTLYCVQGEVVTVSDLQDDEEPTGPTNESEGE